VLYRMLYLLYCQLIVLTCVTAAQLQKFQSRLAVQEEYCIVLAYSGV
jgi:hypothetical protein